MAAREPVGPVGAAYAQGTGAVSEGRGLMDGVSRCFGGGWGCIVGKGYVGAQVGAPVGLWAGEVTRQRLVVQVPEAEGQVGRRLAMHRGVRAEWDLERCFGPASFWPEGSRPCAAAQQE